MSIINLAIIKNCFQKKKNSAFKIRFIIYNGVEKV